MFGISLHGRTAIVTGAGRGIGRGIAVALARAGVDVALASRTPSELAEVAAEIRALGRRAPVAPTDATDRVAVKALVDGTVAGLGRLDVMVNDAGIAPFTTPFLETSPEGFDAGFRANVDGIVQGTRAAGRVLLAQGSGSVLNLASIDAFMAAPGLAYHNAAKAAVVSLTRTLALEWAGRGVRVKAIAPGWIDTPINAPEKAGPRVEARIIAQIPMGRWGRPEEIAAAAVFLCSDAGSFITGEVLVVDGGRTARER